MIVVGLTGSIGMGKSTAGAMLETLGIPVHDADAEVKSLLAPDSPARPALASAFPYFSYPQIYGTKDRKTQIRIIKPEALGKIIFEKDEEREKLESILHPYVRAAQNDFIRGERALGRDIVALDIPLLFETGRENWVDVTVVVTAPDFVQQSRVLGRPGMSVEKFSAVLRRQMPDREKCARADYVVHSGLGRAHMMKELRSVVQKLKYKTGEVV